MAVRDEKNGELVVEFEGPTDRVRQVLQGLLLEQDHCLQGLQADWNQRDRQIRRETFRKKSIAAELGAEAGSQAEQDAQVRTETGERRHLEADYPRETAQGDQKARVEASGCQPDAG